jgi:peptidyl-prolyl cis-trans isomerase A (cyclophilin A)
MTRFPFAATALALALALAAPDSSLAQETPPPQGPPTMQPRVKMTTTLGDIVLELDADKAPITVLNFLRYLREGYYTGTVFHRVMSSFMIQGGGFTAEMDQKREGLHEPIKNEWRNGLKNVRGSIAMARTRVADSATSQFFINVVDNPNLDLASDGAAYCVFGKVVEGLETVDKIRNTEVAAHPKYDPGQPVTPVVPVVIQSVTLMSNFDQTKAEAMAKLAMEAEMRQLDEAIAKTEAETGKKFAKTASGLMHLELRAGTGPQPQPTDTVEVHYLGTFLDGSKFDSSYDRNETSSFGLNQVIRGWTEGVGMMKVGAKWKFIIPPDLAYGPQGRPGIPPNSTLVFEVELISIK